MAGMLMIRVIAVCAATALAGCAGSPVTVYNLPPEEMRYVPDEDLCRTYNFRGFYSGATPNVVAEVRNRDIDCTPGKITPARLKAPQPQ